MSIENPLQSLDFGPEYAAFDDVDFIAKYYATCRCGGVRYEVSSDPLSAKICHCHDCQVMHGAPMQWAAIFHKRNVRFSAGVSHLRFYNSAQNLPQRRLPCKVSCALCATPIADEGRNMWLAFPTLFDFGDPPRISKAFRPSCHIFYARRALAIEDGLPKWSGHRAQSTLL